MFDIAWSELLIIAVVALIFIGPKDLPKAMRTAARWVRAGQKLAREFQGHVDELVREAELEELREKARKAAMSPMAHVQNAIDPDREISSAFTQPEGFHASVMRPSEHRAAEAEPPASEPEPEPEQAQRG